MGTASWAVPAAQGCRDGQEQPGSCDAEVAGRCAAGCGRWILLLSGRARGSAQELHRVIWSGLLSSNAGQSGGLRFRSAAGPLGGVRVAEGCPDAVPAMDGVASAKPAYAGTGAWRSLHGCAAYSGSDGPVRGAADGRAVASLPQHRLSHLARSPIAAGPRDAHSSHGALGPTHQSLRSLRWSLERAAVSAACCQRSSPSRTCPHAEFPQSAGAEDQQGP
mmetsp:Transcript_23345/g.54290  ORF Transcript_23345/g.54290 Transcript_23345/m.54290 type:complete len:220 (+) Transcript_23345:1273-1932(+)